VVTSAPLAHFGTPDEVPAPAERHYAPSEVATLWKLDVETIRRLFEDEPGVLVLQSPKKRGTRSYRTIRIPESILVRVYHQRLKR
jgi:hypothetical protein